MTAPYQRRRDPQPIGRGWELAAASAGGILIVIALAALAGLGVASAIFGGGWVWPHGIQTITQVLAGLLHGHPGSGLAPDQLHRVPGPVPVYGCITAGELLLITVAAIAGGLFARYRRPGDARGGMATRREAQQALGESQLRTARAIIRPDRYRKEADRGARRRGGSRCVHSLVHSPCGTSTDPADASRSKLCHATVDSDAVSRPRHEPSTPVSRQRPGVPR